ncbi:MAG: peptidoglycan DD-metalloendopeptidase family protein [Pseudomonadota bacterium]|nr:peptidoglycan DD-metalloendopeptidase family protein [Pseudomonadota bacterium]
MSQSLQIQMQWRAESLAENVSFDPNKRPRKLPRPFVKQPWDNEIPLLADEVTAQLSSDFGWRTLNRRHDFHSGIDIVAAPGATVFTPVTGEVIHTKVAGTDSGIVVFDGERQHTFWHTRPGKGLRVGQKVDLGDAVGTLVPWGTRTHLHYSVHLTGNTKSQRARKDSNAIDPLTLVQRLREQAYALNDRDGDSLSTLLRDAQHRALLIEAARGENSAALGVPADGTLVSGADASDPAGDRVSSAVTDAAVDEIGEVGEVVDDAMVEVSADPAALEEIESAEVALVSTLSTASSTLAPVGTPVGAPVGVPAAVPGNAEDEASAGITFSLSRNGSFRLGSKQPGAEPEEPTESFSLEAIVTLLQNR